MSSSFKSHENLLSSRAMGRSEPTLSGSPNYRTRAFPDYYICRKSDATGAVYEDQLNVHSEKQLLKSLVVVGIGHVFVFSALSALQSLQSSLFLETGLGLQALCVVYSCAVFSGLYGPAFVQKFTPNWTAVLSVVLVALFVSAFFYPRLYSLMPCAVALGLALGPFFSAEMTFLMTMVSRMSYLTSSIRERVQQKYMRLFLFCTNSGRFWGHIIVAVLIHYGGNIYVFFTGNQHHLLHGMNPRLSIADMNMPPSPYATVARPSLCALEKASDDHVFRNPTSYVFILPLNLTLMLISVFLGMTFLGVAMITTLLDKCDFYTRENAPEPRTLQQLWKVVCAFGDPQFRLWIPFMVFMGLAQGFLSADFTRSYVSCALGLEIVAYTMMCDGGMNAVSAVMVHLFSKYIQRATIMAVGVVCQAGLLMVLWLWVPVKDDVAVFYIIATGWGMCHAIWETYIMTYLAKTYTDEWQAPFSAYYMCQWLGLAAAFGWSSAFVTEIKVYILAGTLACAVAAYAVLEIKTYQRRKEQERVTEL